MSLEFSFSNNSNIFKEKFGNWKEHVEIKYKKFIQDSIKKYEILKNKAKEVFKNDEYVKF